MESWNKALAELDGIFLNLQLFLSLQYFTISPSFELSSEFKKYL